MLKKIPIRVWVTLITFILLAVILYFSFDELVYAWSLLEKVNLWILALLLPVQLMVYYSAGEMVFEYLRAKKEIDPKVSRLKLVRLAFEQNFVNHLLPSGGVSGVSYMSWQLQKFGVSAGKATMAQVIRYVLAFAVFVVFLMISVVVVTFDSGLNRWIIFTSCSLVTAIIVFTMLGIYLFKSKHRVVKFSDWISKYVNGLTRRLTGGKKRILISPEKNRKFFIECHDDYLKLIADKKVLKKPLLWAIVYTICDCGLFMITFWALDHPINPAPVLIAYGVASLVGFIVITPGGAGAYEAAMVMILATAGIKSSVALAGIVLTRAILLTGTIVFGYVFYQSTIMKYGKRSQPKF